MSSQYSFFLEQSPTPIYQRIIKGFKEALTQLGHTVTLIDPTKFSSAQAYLTHIQNQAVDYCILSNSAGLLSAYSEELGGFLFELIDPQIIFIHHNHLFSNLLDTRQIECKLKAFQKLKHKSFHFCLEHYNFLDLKRIGIEQAYPVYHASEFQRINLRETYQYNLSFVGHVLPSLGQEFDEVPQSHYFRTDFWNRLVNLDKNLEPSALSFAARVSSSECEDVNDLIMKYFYVSVLHLHSHAFRGELIKRIDRAEIDIIGGDPAYLHGLTSNQRIEKPTVRYSPAIENYSETQTVYANSKINLNITSLQFDTAVINRVIDIGAAGGFVLTDWKSDLEKITSVAQAISYRTLDELNHKIDYYLHPDHEPERLELAEALHQDVKQHCTYAAVVEFILSKLDRLTSDAETSPQPDSSDSWADSEGTIGKRKEFVAPETYYSSDAASSPINIYWHYLQQYCPSLNPASLSHLVADLKAIAWDEPTSALDLNNFAVIALIEAEQCENISLRAINLDMAREALIRGVRSQPGHPLCSVHLAMLYSLLGDSKTANEIAYPALVEFLQPAYDVSCSIPVGLVYLPPNRGQPAVNREHLQPLLQTKDGYAQTLMLAIEVLYRSPLMFGCENGLRFLQLATQVIPNSATLNLKTGLANLQNLRLEGLLYLHRANQLTPNQAPILQTLYLSYRELQQIETAQHWLQFAQACAQQYPQMQDWKWTELSIDAGFTYATLADGLLLAVEPSFRSIVTSVLLGEGDWFEAEMEFWRNQLQPGMTVIDVGANVGVYAFSAAQKAGASGRVLAVEPFSKCVQYLQETIRINQFDWVKVFAGAASDRHGTVHLALYESSELNEVITDSSALPESGNFETVSCFPLDSLIESEKLSRVDWLKIDAEGHEMQVLQGSDRLLSEFAPNILYENISANTNNRLVAAYLQSKGYQLFRYQPYLQNLIPINSTEDLQGCLNIIALPMSRLDLREK